MAIRATTWKHIRRSPYQAMAAILTMFLTFLLGGLFFITTLASIFILQYFETKPQITVFFSDAATESNIRSLQETLTQTGKTSGLKFVSKDDALAIYREQNKNDPLLLEMVTADILPSSLEVSAINPRVLPELAEIIKKVDFVQDTVYQKDVVDALISWTNAIRITGGILAGLLAIDSILIIMTVIGMKIATRREEIEILKLVGASPWYIRFPFLFEGALYGLFGSLKAWAVLTILIIWLRPEILAFMGAIPIISWVLSDPFSSQFLFASAGFLGSMLSAGFLLGCIGSMVSVGRYLKF